MTGQKPPPWFTEQEDRSAEDEDFKRRREALLQELPQLLARQKDRGRAEKFLPYLLVRSVLGDRGDRPINVPFWESPDIWTAPGDPASAPDVPADHGGTVTAGRPATIYAHVWNLGFAPLAGIHVEFYWFDPSLSIDGTNAHLIGTARVELAGRGMQGSHKLVKCPAAWVPVMANGGHECLMVRAWGIGDPLGANEWKPWFNRHIGQRNISVVSAGSNISQLVASLNATRGGLGATLQLIQVGAAEAALAGKIAAPGLRLADLQTHVLGEIDTAGRVIKAAAGMPTSAMLAPVHALAEGGVPAAPRFHAEGVTHAIDVEALFGDLRLRRGAGNISERVRRAEAATSAGSHLADLLSASARLNQVGPAARPPRRGEAQIVRVASFQGEQLVGGYTMVVTGARR